jgi:hypothetical protein
MQKFNGSYNQKSQYVTPNDLYNAINPSYYNVNKDTYYITNIYNIKASVADSNIFLPKTNIETININIINNSGGYITINTQNNDIIVSSSYTPSSGLPSIILKDKNIAKFINIKDNNNNFFSWLVFIS